MSDFTLLGRAAMDWVWLLSYVAFAALILFAVTR